MKRVLSFLLAVMLVISALPVSYAVDTHDYSQGTTVKYTAANNEEYTITVPAKLIPGNSGTVTLEGAWASDTTITVTAQETVTLTNNISGADVKILDINFEGISEAGSNVEKQKFTKPVSVEPISNAIFGVWSGHFYYNVNASKKLPVIPAGAVYTAADGAVYKEGDAFPETVTAGDVYDYGNYQYSYQRSYFYHGGFWDTSTTSGWGVYCINDVADPGPILSSINGEPVTSMERTFYNHHSLVTAPAIPNSVTSMDYTFWSCTNLVVAPTIPSGVTTAYMLFASCTSLATYKGSTAPEGDFSGYVLPNRVTNLGSAFSDCTNLVTAPTIIPNSVTDMGNAFSNCTNLIQAPAIPSSILNISSAFSNCTSLTGTIIINIDEILDNNGYFDCFTGVDFDAQNLTLTGTCNILDEFGATGINYCADCNGKCQNNH